MSILKILLVDDNPEFLKVAAHFLKEHGAVEVVGLAKSGGEAIRKVHDLVPDLVLMDLSMPGINGLEATRQIKALPVAPHVVILTLHDGPEIQSFAQAAGADDFVTKSDFGDYLPPLLARFSPRMESAPAHDHN
jgi:CheY-like chemotaxis protein